MKLLPALWRQLVLAATVCLVGLFLAEWFIPASVLPFWTPYPFLAVLFIGLATLPVDLTPVPTWKRVVSLLAVAAIAILGIIVLFLHTALSSRSTVLLFIAAFTGSLTFIGALYVQQKTKYD